MREDAKKVLESEWHEFTEAEYFKYLAQYWYVIALIHCGNATEENITDKMEQAYSMYCQRDDLFN